MDVLGHALYGATICSRTGLAGGRRGAVNPDGTRKRFDWTVWAAAGFSLLPDALSLGLFLVPSIIAAGEPDWHGMPAYIMTLYRFNHNLLVACLLAVLCGVLWRPLFVPALAWPLHVVADLFLHGPGRFQTAPLYPLSDFRINGINWWEHSSVTLLYIAILPVLWFLIVLWRRAGSRPVPVGRKTDT